MRNATRDLQAFDAKNKRKLDLDRLRISQSAACCRTPGMGIALRLEEMRRLKGLGGTHVRIRHQPVRPESTAPWLLHFHDHGGHRPLLNGGTNLCTDYGERPGPRREIPTAPPPR